MDHHAGNGQRLRPEDLGRTAIEASSLYGFLARFFREEISAEFLRELISANMRINLSEVGVELDTWLSNESEDQVLERLAVEYTALFLGPGGHISPHESVQAEDNGILMSERTIAVRKFIEQAGFGYSDTFAGIHDHISVELEFLSSLTRHEAVEWQREDFDRAANCLEYQKEFLDQHLGQWVVKFCDRVVDRAEEKIYRDIAKLTKDFVLSEIDDVNSRLAFALEQKQTIEPVLSSACTG